MEETYTPDEFARCYSLRGYGSREQARQWLKRHGMGAATEADFERCWREVRRGPVVPHSGKYIALNVDGTNPSAPQNAPNSRGESFARTMRREQARTDAQEQYWLRRMAEERLEEMEP